VFFAEVLVDVVVNAGVTNFVGSFDNFVNVVGDFVDLAIFGFDGFELFLHFVFKESI